MWALVAASLAGTTSKDASKKKPIFIRYRKAAATEAQPKGPKSVQTRASTPSNKMKCSRESLDWSQEVGDTSFSRWRESLKIPEKPGKTLTKCTLGKI